MEASQNFQKRERPNVQETSPEVVPTIGTLEALNQQYQKARQEAQQTLQQAEQAQEQNPEENPTGANTEVEAFLQPEELSLMEKLKNKITEVGNKLSALFVAGSGKELNEVTAIKENKAKPVAELKNETAPENFYSTDEAEMIYDMKDREPGTNQILMTKENGNVSMVHFHDPNDEAAMTPLTANKISADQIMDLTPEMIVDKDDIELTDDMLVEDKKAEIETKPARELRLGDEVEVMVKGSKVIGEVYQINLNGEVALIKAGANPTSPDALKSVRIFNNNGDKTFAQSELNLVIPDAPARLEVASKIDSNQSQQDDDGQTVAPTTAQPVASQQPTTAEVAAASVAAKEISKPEELAEDTTDESTEVEAGYEKTLSQFKNKVAAKLLTNKGEQTINYAKRQSIIDNQDKLTFGLFANKLQIFLPGKENKAAFSLSKKETAQILSQYPETARDNVIYLDTPNRTASIDEPPQVEKRMAA